jgi:GDP-4-dehydro-6-deoxy-D-mannose reductase
MINILITGSTGFIGKHLVNCLKKNKLYNLICISSKDGDICNIETWNKLPKAEIIIHLAASTYIPESWDNPFLFINNNFIGTVHALNFAKKNKAKFIFISTYLYGNPQVLPINETSKLDANNPYSFSKLQAENACEFYSKFFDLNITILRPFNIYGPGQNKNFLIPTIINQINITNEITIQDGKPKRDYLYIDDLINAITIVLHNNFKFEIFNLGFGESYSINDLVEILKSIKNKEILINDRKIRRVNEIMNTIADISKAKNLLNWEPKISITEGLTKVINSI